MDYPSYFNSKIPDSSYSTFVEGASPRKFVTQPALKENGINIAASFKNKELRKLVYVSLICVA
jgi:hypothetical protein